MFNFHQLFFARPPTCKNGKENAYSFLYSVQKNIYTHNSIHVQHTMEWNIHMFVCLCTLMFVRDDRMLTFP